MAVAVNQPTAKIVVLGGANFDYLIKADALPDLGETTVGGELQEAPGGKGANQAIAAARLGANVAFVGRVGDDDRGRRVLARFAEEHVDSAAVVIDDGAPTGVALVMVGGDGEKMIMTAPGANLRLSVADVQAATATIADAAILLLQLEPPLATVLAAVDAARSARVRIVLDAAPPAAVPDELLAAVEVVRANAGEAATLTGLEVHDAASARKAGAALLRRGANAACIAAGDGDLLVWADGEEWLPYLPTDVVDATGAGDAFAAALAVGLARGQPLPEAARLGRAAAAVKVTQLGAQAGLPTRDDVLLRLIEDGHASRP